MEPYIMTDEEWLQLKENLNLLYDYRLLLPGAIEHTAEGNENRYRALEKIVREMQKPDDLNEAIFHALNEMSVILTQIETRHIRQRRR